MRRQRELQAAAARGPYTDMRELLALRAAAARLKLQPPSRALGELAGTLRSARRGRGIEFEELRPYEAGDDVRTIDWRVTARTGRAHTRLFREERERPVFVLVDQRQGMFFGSRHTLKSVQAVHAAALLAWAALAGGDRIGGLVVGEHGHHEVRPRRDRRAALALLRSCHEFNHRLGLPAPSRAGATGLEEALTSARRVMRPGSMLLLVSDFGGWDRAAEAQLHLLARHCEICAIHVHDPLEQALPALGRAVASDGARRVAIDAADATLRERYRTLFAAETQALGAAFARLHAPLVPLATDAPALEVLARYFRGNVR